MAYQIGVVLVSFIRRYALIFFIAFGIFLRFYGFWDRSLWADEILYLETEKFDFQILQRIIIWIVKIALQKFPSLDVEFVVRIPYVFISSVSLVVLYKIISFFERDRGMIFFVFFCCSFFISVVGQDATGWSICLLFYLLSVLEFIKILWNKGGKVNLFFLYSLASIFSKEISAIWLVPFFLYLYLKGKINLKSIVPYVLLVLVIVGFVAIIYFDKIEISRDMLTLVRRTFLVDIFSLEIYLDTFTVFSGSWWQFISYIYLIFSLLGFIFTKSKKFLFYFLIFPSFCLILLVYLFFHFFSVKYILPLFFAYLIALMEGTKYTADFLLKRLKIPKLLILSIFVSIFVVSNLRTFYGYWVSKETLFLPFDVSGTAEEMCRMKVESKNKILVKSISPVELLNIPVLLGLNFYLKRCGVSMSIVEKGVFASKIVKTAGVLEVSKVYMERVGLKKEYLIFLIPPNIESSGILKWWKRKLLPIDRIQSFLHHIFKKENIRINDFYVRKGIIIADVSGLSEERIDVIESLFNRFIMENFFLRYK